jgi:hypothetical protein
VVQVKFAHPVKLHTDDECASAGNAMMLAEQWCNWLHWQITMDFDNDVE